MMILTLTKYLSPARYHVHKSWKPKKTASRPEMDSKKIWKRIKFTL